MKRKLLFTVLAAGLLSVPVLSGCNGDKVDDTRTFSFAIDIDSGRNEIEMNVDPEEPIDKIVVVDNNVDNIDREYEYVSSNEEVAMVDQMGNIYGLTPGKVSFLVKETNSGLEAQLPMEINIVAPATVADGGFNYSSASSEVTRRTQILAKLEKYAMDSHLTGITLFDNGGYVKYSDRINLPTTDYITGYGFGLLGEGSIDETKNSIQETNADYKPYYHSAISQDPLTINALNASGSQVSDLSSYITSSYWSTKMNDERNGYIWYPVLAKKELVKPVVVNDQGQVSLGATAETPIANDRPIPLEKHNELNMYKKWRIYVRTDLQYKFTGNDANLQTFNNRNVSIDDYEFIYQFLLTGKNALSRGAEMAADTSYGIKGAMKFYNDTLEEDNQASIDAKWANMKNEGNLGIKTGTDDNGSYLDIELVNAIDDFTAMYTLSSSLVSPLPRSFIEAIGANNDGVSKIITGAQRYGNFNSKPGEDSANKILNYVLNLGPYSLSRWEKKQLIVFSRNNDWFEVSEGRYKIKGIHNRIIDTSNDSEAVYKEFNASKLDVTGIPIKYVETEKTKPLVYKTKGDSTFKLNVNSCDQTQWDYLFGPQGKINKNSHWTVKPWMSNSNFLNGLFFSINRNEFATKRGVTPSINYFSDAYMADPVNGISYNDRVEHLEATNAYHTYELDETTRNDTYNTVKIKEGTDNYGYDYDKAVNCFKLAVNQLAKEGKLVMGTKSKPTKINIHIKWMYSTDVKEYGEDIKHYFESAFNDDAVCGGAVKLNVTQDAVTNWEDVYNEWMMKGQFDLGFGAISGNTLNPLNFLEVLKTDNSSGFTLNWGTDTSKVDTIHPIIYDNNDGTGAKKWSFDALWEVADHGGIVENGVNVKPVKQCYSKTPTTLDTNTPTNVLRNGFKVEIPIEFANVPDVEFGLSHLDISTSRGTYELTDAQLVPDGSKYKVVATCPATMAQEINQEIFNSNFSELDEPTDDQLNPFLWNYYDTLWTYDLYYTFQIGGGSISENYVGVKTNSVETN